MAYYRCYFLGCDESFMSVNDLEAGSDSDAIVQASLLVAKRPQINGFELWQCDRHVYKHVRPLGDAVDREAERPGLSVWHSAVIPLTLSEARRMRAAANTRSLSLPAR